MCLDNGFKLSIEALFVIKLQSFLVAILIEQLLAETNLWSTTFAWRSDNATRRSLIYVLYPKS